MLNNVNKLIKKKNGTVSNVQHFKLRAHFKYRSHFVACNLKIYCFFQLCFHKFFVFAKSRKNVRECRKTTKKWDKIHAIIKNIMKLGKLSKNNAKATKLLQNKEKHSNSYEDRVRHKATEKWSKPHENMKEGSKKSKIS